MPTGLLDLPVEILTQICSQLPPDSWYHDVKKRQRSLASLSLTSHTLRTIAQPILYHQLHAYEYRAAFHFLRALLRTPRLAEHVRVINILHGGIQTLRDQTEIRKVEEAAVEYGIELPDVWNKSVRARDEGNNFDSYGYFTPEYSGPVTATLVAFLLRLTSQLEEAHWRMFSGLMKLDHFRHQITPLQSLRRLTISSSSARSGWIFDHVLPVIAAAPNLQFLHLDQCGAVGTRSSIDHITLTTQALPLARLTELHLTKGAPYGLVVPFLNAVGPSLRKLTIEYEVGRIVDSWAKGVVKHPGFALDDGEIVMEPGFPGWIEELISRWQDSGTLEEVTIRYTNDMFRTISTHTEHAACKHAHAYKAVVI
ncbi:hypothetical protein NKR23_g6432 [Pleurostoma richardsiae]|uniref:F-box domain-containing protein n=1 Tax=Pleurostoma richardsiae TaxID=41990 RepID=A0AA38RR08_9PEZI|nr:hypothetical protein NKR23_g6432 [Pleurostoma richardsiae]